MMIQSLTILNLIFMMVLGFSFAAKNDKKPKTDPNQKIYFQIISKYDASKTISAKVVRTVKSELIGKETQYEGKIFWAQKKVRWETDKPQKNLLIYDGSFIWNVSYPSAAFPDEVQITRSKIDKNSEKNLLFTNFGKLKKEFDLLKSEAQEDEIKIFLKEKDPKSQVKDVVVVLSKKKKLISQISYKDDVENESILKFTDTEFDKELKTTLFSYKPPKGVKVQDL